MENHMHERLEIQRSHPLWWLFCPKPTVKILFYTDSSSVVLTSDPNEAFGTGIMRDWLLADNLFYVNFQIDQIDRHSGGHAANKLSPALLSGYDEVWFFGVMQCNTAGAPQNELTDSEVDALRIWMAQGGALVTGDHANPNPEPANGLDPLLNLGRALGHRIPRAGELRKWEGLPSSDYSDVPGDPMGPKTNHNTQQPHPGEFIDSLLPQEDDIPQPLLLKWYSLWTVHPWYLHRERPHPLFCGRDGPISVFPDHMHEGMIVIPAQLSAEWPAGIAGPEVIASGTDTRTGRVWPVAAAYDGEGGNVGRIVADSTWHHYFNINLKGFPVGSPTQQAIADYYVNLAVWLAPQDKRSAMGCRLWWWLFRHPLIEEISLSPPWFLGEQAFDVLRRAASRCTVEHLIFVDWPWRYLLRERPPPWPPEEWIVGSILYEYQLAANKPEPGERRELQLRGLRRAVREHTQTLEDAFKRSSEAVQLVDQISGDGPRL
jgi:hypothetical protein